MFKSQWQVVFAADDSSPAVTLLEQGQHTVEDGIKFPSMNHAAQAAPTIRGGYARHYGRGNISGTLAFSRVEYGQDYWEAVAKADAFMRLCQSLSGKQGTLTLNLTQRFGDSGGGDVTQTFVNSVIIGWPGEAQNKRAIHHVTFAVGSLT